MTEQREWLSKRNCSISPSHLLAAYAGLCGISLAVALFFLWHGAWYVMCFALLELVAVGAAFFLNGRHATDSERIALGHDFLLVELIRAEQAFCIQFDPRRTVVKAPVAYHCLISLEERGLEVHGLGKHRTRVEVGRFLPSPRRQQFARELHTALAN